MKVSVALCTYNGAKYLEAQLDSFVNQTRLPDELVVCDDGSTDQTWAILEQWAETASFPVHLHRNAENLGVGENFGKAIALCEGDIIFLSDQDDVWLPQKIDRMAQAFMANQQVGLAFCDSLLVDEHLEPLGMTYWQKLKLTPRRRQMMAAGRAAEVLMRRNYVAGATAAFRSEYRSKFLPIAPHWVHDYWIASIIGFYSPLIAVPEPLNMYRQHPDNQIGLGKALRPPDDANRFTFRQERYRLLYQRMVEMEAKLAQLDDVPDRKSLKRRIRDRLIHFQSRAAFPRNRVARLPIIAREIFSGRYMRYAGNFVRSAYSDFVRH